MIATLRESKAKLSELVERAVAGKEILITVRGRPKARLVAAQSSHHKGTLAGWPGELHALQQTLSSNPSAVSSGPSEVEELRNERW